MSLFVGQVLGHILSRVCCPLPHKLLHCVHDPQRPQNAQGDTTETRIYILVNVWQCQHLEPRMWEVNQWKEVFFSKCDRL